MDESAIYHQLSQLGRGQPKIIRLADHPTGASSYLWPSLRPALTISKLDSVAYAVYENLQYDRMHFPGRRFLSRPRNFMSCRWTGIYGCLGECTHRHAAIQTPRWNDSGGALRFRFGRWRCSA